jgi:hypothetical protein
MSPLRGALAVLTGIGVFTVFLLAVQAIGRALLGAEPEWINRTDATRVAWLLGNIGSMVIAGYVAACIATRARTAHAIIVGTIQTGLTLAAFLTLRDQVTPAWLWISGIVTTVPAAWFGGWLGEGRRFERPARSTSAPPDAATTARSRCR